MKISASIYSSKDKNLEQLVNELDAHRIDMLHVDCVDNPKVFEDIKRIRAFSKTPIDLHIIAADPTAYFSLIEETGVEYVSFQYENLQQIPVLPKYSKTKFGLAILPGTSWQVFEPVRNDYSFILLMSTVPGQSGGVFNSSSFQKIIELKQRFPQTQLHVDGGVTDRIAYILRLLGVSSIVSGSYLMNHESLGAGMLSLHRAPAAVEADFMVDDFTVPAAYLPVMEEEQLTFANALQTIEQYRQGFLLITRQGVLTGVVSNADLRRGMLQYMAGNTNVSDADFVNKNPVTIAHNATLADMVQLLNNLNFIVLFLPVLDNEKRLKGAVLLNQLTRV